MAVTLQIFLLGEAHFVWEGRSIILVQAPRVLSVLVYVLLHRATPQPRSQLAFLLWPDTSEAQAHSNLRKVLHQLRQLLPEADRLLVVDRHSIQWRPQEDLEWTLDVQDFEQALVLAGRAMTGIDEQRALAQAVRLYRDDFFAGSYEEWILGERDRLRQLYLEAAGRLTTLLEEARDYTEALKLCQRLLRFDPLREATYRQLMRLYALQGDRAAALRTYHSCATTLEHELGIEPAEGTRRLYEALLQMDVSLQTRTASPLVRSGEAPLLGRQREWVQLQAAWQQALKGRPRLVIVSGEAGIGKTRLADELLAWVSRQGMPTARAACYATGGEMAYAPVTGWLRSEHVQGQLEALDELWLTEIARLLPDILTRQPTLRRPGLMREGWQRQHFYEALLHAIIQPGEQGRPLLLLLDDLQWCDHETLEWLHYVLRFPYARPASFLLLGTIRSEEVQEGHPLTLFLAALQRDGLVSELPLGPLEASEITALAKHTAGRPLAPPLLTDLVRQTEGNPLFVVEMVRSGLLTTIPDGADVSTQPQVSPSLVSKSSDLPQKVQAILAMRLEQLSPTARELASLAAVIGRTFDVDILVRASSQGEDEVVSGLDELWQRRIVREQADESYDFSHDKLRQQAYDALSAVRRRQLHRRVAEAFACLYANDLDSVSQQIATHYERAGQRDRAIPYYFQAGNQAASMYANEEAVALYQQAIAIYERGNVNSSGKELPWELLARLLERQANLLGALGRTEEQRAAYERALLVVPEQVVYLRARLQRGIARSYQHPSQRQRLLAEFDVAESLLMQDPDQSSLEWKREWISFQLDKLLPLQVHPLSGGEMGALIERMKPVVEQAATPEQRAQFELSAATTHLVQEHYQASTTTLALFRHAVQAIEEADMQRLLGFARFGLGTSLLYAEQLDEAEQQLQAAMQSAQKVGNTQLYRRCRLFLAYAARQRGQVELVRELISFPHEVLGVAFAGTLIAHQSWLSWRDGDLEQAESYARRALEQWRQQHPVNPFQWTALGPLLGICLRQQRLPEAITCVQAMLEPEQRQPPTTLRDLFAAAIQTWHEHQPERAHDLLQQSLPLARQQGYV